MTSRFEGWPPRIEYDKPFNSEDFPPPIPPRPFEPGYKADPALMVPATQGTGITRLSPRGERLTNGVNKADKKAATTNRNGRKRKKKK